MNKQVFGELVNGLSHATEFGFSYNGVFATFQQMADVVRPIDSVLARKLNALAFACIQVQEHVNSRIER